MLDVLNIKDYEKRQYCDYRRPKPKVSCPDAFEVFDLEGSLQCSGNDESADSDLVDE
jgi:hypothetical protein